MSSSVGLLRVVMYATRNDSSCMHALVSGANATRGVHVSVIGVGEAWRGFGHRMDAFRAFCESVPSEDLVMSMDAYDSIWATLVPDHTASEIQSRFRASNVKILFGAECGCWPMRPLRGNQFCDVMYPRAPTSYR